LSSKQYKVGVYQDIRELLGKFCSSAVKEGLESLPAVLPKEKKILITLAVAQVHKKLATSPEGPNHPFTRAFLATGTLLPVNHCDATNGRDNNPYDDMISIQGFTHYDYKTVCTRTKILERVETLHLEEVARVEAEATKLRKEAARNACLQSFAHVGPIIAAAVKPLIDANIAGLLVALLEATENKPFIISGSYPNCSRRTTRKRKTARNTLQKPRGLGQQSHE
jgi:hypothetical protein